MLKFLGKILDSNEKELRRLQPIVEQINRLEADISRLTDSQLSAKTSEFKLRLERGETLDEILPEAFAVVREAAKRTIGERHYDVQLIAGIALHQGKIAEQKTGEGKTLSATTAVYLNALTGKGVHVVTVNDYLAKRDANWMGPIYNFLDLSVGYIVHDIPPGSKERKAMYACDITYGTNNEFGFDYLRDNMVTSLDQMVQRGHHFAIVDEVDSILIDEARTPLIISAPFEEATDKYYQFANLVEQLTPGTDYVVDEKLRTANLTEHGILKVEKKLGVDNLYEKDFQTIHHIEQALKAKTLFVKDRDYVVKDNQIIIVDEFTGRLLPGRRYSEGLHQAIEAKERVPIQQESKTLATITFQNYFRLYEKLAGMTGTAATEAEEFHKIYGLEVVVVPTNKPMIRKDYPDVVYKTARAKFTAVAAEVADCYRRGQPVLIGTTSIEKNELLSALLKRKGIPHEVLNAKNHAKEAEIIAQAGQKGAVTLATNIAGRGVDIKLGKGVAELGGLHVIGTERHESRRIDNQLRGRSGRQGDPGSSRFYVSLEDDIMRLFGGEQVAKLMTMFKLPEDTPIEHPLVSKAIENAQIKVESHNFDIRKHLVQYDDVINKQRDIIYSLRRRILELASGSPSEGVSENNEAKIIEFKNEIMTKVKAEIENLVSAQAAEILDEAALKNIVSEFVTIIPLDDAGQKQLVSELAKFKDKDEISKFLGEIADRAYKQRQEKYGAETVLQLDLWIYLSVIDTLWMEHLDTLDDLREGIGLRGYAQRDPLVEYKAEAFSLFEKLMANIDYELIHRLFKVQIQPVETVISQSISQGTQVRQTVEISGGNVASNTSPVVRKRLGRNDPCWCGSGKKFKKCHYPQLP